MIIDCQDLREQIDKLQEQIKKLKKFLKIYAKRMKSTEGKNLPVNDILRIVTCLVWACFSIF